MPWRKSEANRGDVEFRERVLRMLGWIAFFIAFAVTAHTEGGPAGIWAGRYACAQDETGLTLRVEPRSGTVLRALFHFYAVRQNPGVPGGCFEMTGTSEQDHNEVSFAAGGWLLHLPGYVTVNLAGQVDATGKHFSGSVTGPNCGGFDLIRVGGPRRVADACHSGETEISSIR